MATKPTPAGDANQTPTSTPTPQHQQSNAPLAPDMTEMFKMFTAMMGAASQSQPGVNANALAEHFQEEKEFTRAPWKRTKANLLAYVKDWNATYDVDNDAAWEEVSNEFVAAGKNGLLSVNDAMEMAYLLADDRVRYQRARALLALSSLKQLQLHNFGVAKEAKAFEDKAGPVLESLPVPLFPAGMAHKEVNDRIIAEMKSTIEGAGPVPTKMIFTAFGRAPREVLKGAGYSAVVQDGAVDLTPVQDAFEGLRIRVETLENRQPYQQQPYQQQPYQQHQPQQGYQPRGRGNYDARGRGRGGGRAGYNRGGRATARGGYNGKYYGAGAEEDPPNEARGEQE